MDTSTTNVVNAEVVDAEVVDDDFVPKKKQKTENLELAVYSHSTGAREVVNVLTGHGLDVYTVFVPSLGRERQTLAGRLNRGDHAVAAYLAEKAAASASNRATEHCKLGNIFLSKRDSKGAEAEFRAALALDPKHVNAHYFLGIILFSKDDKVGGEAEFRIALALDPNNVNVHCSLGNILKDKGDLVGAEFEYRTAIALEPMNALAHYKLGVLGRDKDAKAEEADKVAKAEEADKVAKAEEADKDAKAEEAFKVAKAEEAFKVAKAEEADKVAKAQEAAKAWATENVATYASTYAAYMVATRNTTLCVAAAKASARIVLKATGAKEKTAAKAAAATVTAAKAVVMLDDALAKEKEKNMKVEASSAYKATVTSDAKTEAEKFKAAVASSPFEDMFETTNILRDAWLEAVEKMTGKTVPPSEFAKFSAKIVAI